MADWHKTLARTLASHKQCLVSPDRNGFEKVSITAGWCCSLLHPTLGRLNTRLVRTKGTLLTCCWMQVALATCSCKILSNTGSLVEGTTRGQSSTRQNETWLGVMKSWRKRSCEVEKGLKTGLFMHRVEEKVQHFKKCSSTVALERTQRRRQMQSPIDITL